MEIGKRITQNHGRLIWNTMYDTTMIVVEKNLWLSLNTRLTTPINSSVRIVRGMIILIKHEIANR
jgi:hypothetical protein